VQAGARTLKESGSTVLGWTPRRRGGVTSGAFYSNFPTKGGDGSKQSSDAVSASPFPLGYQALPVAEARSRLMGCSRLRQHRAQL